MLRQHFCSGYPPNHAAGECAFCDDVKSAVWVINTHRQRLQMPLLRLDDPELRAKIERGCIG